MKKNYLIFQTDDWGDGKKGGKGGKKNAKSVKGGSKSSAPSTSSNLSANISINSEELEIWLRESQSVPEEILSVIVEKLNQEVHLMDSSEINNFYVSDNNATSQKSSRHSSTSIGCQRR